MENKFQFAKKLIREAGDFIKSNMVNELEIEEKTRFDDLVTNLDKETQELLIANIKQVYPDDHILAEENGVHHNITDGNVWVLDPIDGTVNFVAQATHFAVMIAYYENGIGQFGLIYDVMNDLLYSGGGQFDVCVNDKKLSPFKDRPLNRFLVGCNANMFASNYHGLHDMIEQTLGVRVYGGAGISMAAVMAGQLLAYFSYIQPWDYAAAKVMGEKLGYVLLTIEGKEPDFSQRQKVMFVPKAKLSTIQTYLSKT
ncbi:inositol monophosphatase family protein [Streptococcus sp. SL1232]|uniref:inositol monophosphatase family protein n=1 Tax=Streptococcus vicugnae TaxID=2740579 RepID=UPI0018F66500|nr:inositol monophosphatase family protein [Streptococcus vicugnae]MBJ7540916.1 inositol monophosphatase family protein [Streptococcus vicugnae]